MLYAPPAPRVALIKPPAPPAVVPAPPPKRPPRRPRSPTPPLAAILPTNPPAIPPPSPEKPPREFEKGVRDPDPKPIALSSPVDFKKLVRASLKRLTILVAF